VVDVHVQNEPIILNGGGRLCSTKKSRLWLYGEMIATNAAALSLFLPAIVCGALFRRAWQPYRRRYSSLATGLPSIVERGEAAGVDFDTDIAGAEGYTLEVSEGCSVCWHVVRRRSGSAARRGKPAEVLWPS
jgi:hypothetical protein